MAAMNPHAAITRDEFERTIEELRAEMRASSSDSPAADGTTLEHPREEFVRKDEFRLFKWFAGLALAAILSGMGLLYQGIHQGLAEQREAMERQFADLRAEMHAGFRAITANVDSRFVTVDSRFVAMDSRFASMDSRFDDMDSRFARMDSRFDDMDSRLARMDSRFDDMDSRFASMDSRFDDMDSRFASMDSRFDDMDSRFASMDSRITALQHDVADVKERLARVETLLDVKNRERLPD